MTDEDIAVALEDYCSLMYRVGLIYDELTNQVRRKQLLGGRFGHGGFLLCSHSTVSHGLDLVSYFVVHAETGYPLSWAEDKAEAISTARLMLTHRMNQSRLQSESKRFREAADAAKVERRRLWDEHMAERRQKEVDNAPIPIKSIPRRRRRIFEESQGRCHYCETELILEGEWHVEHKMPRALGGGNEPGNLVAACVPCNMKKRDTTDVEFKARLAKEAA